MLVSTKWLADYIDTKGLAPAELAEKNNTFRNRSRRSYRPFPWHDKRSSRACIRTESIQKQINYRFAKWMSEKK
jgi:hypothetical protein